MAEEGGLPKMTEEGLYVEMWYGGLDGAYCHVVSRVSRLRVTRVDAQGKPEVAYIAWDGLD